VWFFVLKKVERKILFSKQNVQLDHVAETIAKHWRRTIAICKQRIAKRRLTT